MTKFNFDFIGKRKIFFIIPIVIAVITILTALIAGVPVDIEFDEASFSKKLADLVAKYSLEYPGAEDELLNEVIEINAVEDYKSEYKYSTKSDALSEDYETTEFTLDTGKVVIVTYKNADGDTVRFVLNFNIYSVDVNIDGQKFSLGKYEYKRLED